MDKATSIGFLASELKRKTQECSRLEKELNESNNKLSTYISKAREYENTPKVDTQILDILLEQLDNMQKNVLKLYKSSEKNRIQVKKVTGSKKNEPTYTATTEKGLRMIIRDYLINEKSIRSISCNTKSNYSTTYRLIEEFMRTLDNLVDKRGFILSKGFKEAEVELILEAHDKKMGETTKRKISPETIEHAYDLWIQGYTVKEISKEMGINLNSVRNIINIKLTEINEIVVMKPGYSGAIVNRFEYGDEDIKKECIEKYKLTKPYILHYENLVKREK